MLAISPSSIALSSTGMILEFCSLTLLISASISSSVTSTGVVSTSTPLYSPSSTSGFNATVAVKIKSLPFYIGGVYEKFTKRLCSNRTK